jgi:hypothetical protein
MATVTPNFNWPVPTSTDLVKDGATAIEALGDSIDASLVDLKGGTTGQVLSKTTNTDMDFTWVTTDDANAIQNSIVDAKGDLIAATANDTPARLAVGANDYFLQAASGQATGLQWGGTWTSYTPVLTQSNTVTATNLSSRYLKVGKLVTVQVALSITGTGTASNRIRITLPFTSLRNNVIEPIGTVSFYDASSFNVYPGLVVTDDSGTTATFTITQTITTNGSQYIGNTGFTAAIANGDFIGFQATYEVA